jgi:hypothetical protein
MRESQKTRNQKVNDLIAVLLEGPSFSNVKDMFTESCFRKDDGNYVSKELLRVHKKWVKEFIIEQLKKLVNSK